MLAKNGGRFWLAFTLLNVVLIGGFVYAVLQQVDLLTKILPGTFGPDLSPNHSGNMFFLSLLLVANAALITLSGLLGSKLRLLIGIVLVALALPVFCVTYTQAAPNGTALLETAGTPTVNYNVDGITVLQFTGDQIAGALLLDAPEIFHWRLTQAEPAKGNVAFAVSIFLYRALIGFGVLILLISAVRRRTAAPALITAAAAESATQAEHVEPHHAEPVHEEPASHEHAEPDHHVEPEHAEPHHEPAAEHEHDHGHDSGHDPEHSHAHAEPAHNADTSHEAPHTDEHEPAHEPAHELAATHDAPDHNTSDHEGHDGGDSHAQHGHEEHEKEHA